MSYSVDSLIKVMIFNEINFLMTEKSWNLFASSNQMFALFISKGNSSSFYFLIIPKKLVITSEYIIYTHRERMLMA